MFPRKAVGSVISLGGLAGAVGGMLIAAAVGFILQSTGSYLIVFVIAGSAYWLALALFAFLVPRIDTVELT
jgi:ACS family hexuronate transporter-like MFS transporter